MVKNLELVAVSDIKQIFLHLNGAIVGFATRGASVNYSKTGDFMDINVGILIAAYNYERYQTVCM